MISKGHFTLVILLFATPHIGCTYSKPSPHQKELTLILKYKDHQKIHAFNIEGFKYSPEKTKFNYKVWRESKEPKEGLGNYWLSTAKKPLDFFLQAPHKFHDKYSGKILQLILKKYDVALGAENSVHRYQKIPHLGLTKYDLAHTNSSLFMNMSKEFLKLNKKSSIIQLHGFNPKSRKSTAAKSTDIILSSGRRKYSGFSQNIYKCLQVKKFKVLLYGKNATELGGTKNTIGNWANRQGEDKFLHIEMSLNFRRSLVKNHKKLKEFANCILLKK